MADLTADAFAVPTEVEPGILRLTLPMRDGPDHVHCYLLRGADGWTLVDTGPGPMETPWDVIIAALDAPVVRIFITHMHSDHTGGTVAVAEATGAPVLQGRVDYAECERAWGPYARPDEIAEWFLLHGVPPAEQKRRRGSSDSVQFPWNPTLVDAGDEVDGWQVLAMPGHADGHLCLYRDGVLIAGDALLAPITPLIGLWPDSRPDPLGDYYKTLAAIAELAPRVSYGGHGGTIHQPAARARDIAAHHDTRLDRTEAALGAEPRTGYEVSLSVFGRALGRIQRRLAVAETLSHLERLVALGRAERTGNDHTVSWSHS